MRRGLLLIALAATSWGTTGSVTTVLVARAGAHPLVIGAARMWVAAVLLLAAARLGGPLGLAWADRWRWLAMGACMAGFQAAYFTAVTLTGIAVTALLAICSAPLLIALFAWRFLGERPSARTLVALALGVGGTALLVAGPALGARPAAHAAGGVALALGAGLAYALYVVIAKESLAQRRLLPLTAVTFATAAVISTPILALTTAPLLQIARGWPWLLYLGIVATAGAYGLYALGLRRVPASAAGIVSLIEPLTATALGVVVFGERLGPAGALGAVLLLTAIALLVAGRAAAVP